MKKCPFCGATVVYEYAPCPNCGASGQGKWIDSDENDLYGSNARASRDTRGRENFSDENIVQGKQINRIVKFVLIFLSLVSYPFGFVTSIVLVLLPWPEYKRFAKKTFICALMSLFLYILITSLTLFVFVPQLNV
ncbi:MAG: hypothetical protein HFE62_03110 [Firmicutes bacterium]|nr:hypothetical protein [Bacillota bacterium]